MPRKKGTQNKITAETKQAIKDLIDGNITKFRAEMVKLDGKDFINSFIRLLEFVVPKAKEDTNINPVGNFKVEFIANAFNNTNTDDGSANKGNGG